MGTKTGPINGFGKGTASAVPLSANENEGFSPWGPHRLLWKPL